MKRLLAPIVLACLVLSPTLRAEGPSLRPTSQPASVSVLALGDWGMGNKDQKDVAAELGKFEHDAKTKADAMLLAGDNFYVRLSGIEDPQWQSLFEKMYGADDLSMPFYAALGNHDYEGGKAEIELGYAKAHPDSRWKLPSNYYRVDLPKEHPLVSVLMLDSNKDSLSKEQWAAQLAWMEAELAKPRAGAWMICCAHHPLFSNGPHADNGVLQTQWGTLFKKYNLDFYVCGHDHDLQHLQIPDWSPSFVLCGGGGGSIKEMLHERGPFSRNVFGFAAFTFTPDLATVDFIDKTGAVLHEFTRTREGKVTVVKTTGVDKAGANPRKTIGE